MRKVWLLAGFSALAAILGCGGGDGGGGGRNGVSEQEPNDDIGTATFIDGGTAFHGSCDLATDIFDFWRATFAIGDNLNISVAWSDQTGNDVDLVLADPDGFSILDDDTTTPPADSPAEVTAVIGTAGNYRLIIQCSAGSDVEYEGTITR